ncbi:hypothetical protein [Allocoleopsis sp.]
MSLKDVAGVGIAGELRQKDLSVCEKEDVKTKENIDEDYGAHEPFKGKFT